MGRMTDDEMIADYKVALSIFDSRPQMGRETFTGTLSERVTRLFEVRDKVGELAFDLAGGDDAAHFVDERLESIRKAARRADKRSSPV
jgi:hypothetical protein